MSAVMSTLAGNFLVGAFLLISQDNARATQTWLPSDLNPCSYKIAFSEDFSDFRIAANRIGDARWTAHTPWHGDFGDAEFLDPHPNDPFTVSNHGLEITARKKPDGHWTSGLIAAADPDGHGFGTRYGYFEARMKMPPGPGTWPAFWLSSLKPARDPSPSVEIDVVEYYGQFTSAYQAAIHVWHDKSKEPRSRDAWQKHVVDVPKDSLVDDFHNYGLNIQPQTITFYFDRKAVWTVATPEELTFSEYPLLDLALGSGFPIKDTINPSQLEIQYVHIFGYHPGKSQKGCPLHVSHGVGSG